MKKRLISISIIIGFFVMWVNWGEGSTSSEPNILEQARSVRLSYKIYPPLELWVERITTSCRRRRKVKSKDRFRRVKRAVRQALRRRRRAARWALRRRKRMGGRSCFPVGLQGISSAVEVSRNISHQVEGVVSSSGVSEEVIVFSTRKRGRKPTIDTSIHFCPNPECDYYHKLGPGHRIVGNGHCGHDKSHQFLKCQACGKCFCERHGTVFFNLKTDEKTIYRALKAISEGQGINSVARTFDVDEETIRRWLKRAAEHCEMVSDYLIRNLNVSEVQLDELWSFIRKKEKRLSAWEKLNTDYGDRWIWVAFDPVYKLVVAFVVGDHEKEQAETLLRKVKTRLAKGLVPYFTSDELAHYAQVILKVFGRWVQPERKGKRGPFPKPRPEPTLELCYATVNKTRAKGRVVEIATRIVFGTARKVRKCIKNSPVTKAINTAFVERMNLTLRLFNRRLTRKTLGFSKKSQWLELHLHLTLAYYHFVRPHKSLRVRLDKPIPTKGTGSPKKWLKRTPAMAAGITDHVWTMKELLTFRVPIAA